jgi:diguanylate cyclase (GGDEF)-like protein
MSSQPSGVPYGPVVASGVRDAIGDALARTSEQAIARAVRDGRRQSGWLGQCASADIEHLARLLTQLLTHAVRNGVVRPEDNELAAELVWVVLDRSWPTRDLFAFLSIVEQYAVHELTTDEAGTIRREHHEAATQMVHRASFDVLAAVTDKLIVESSGGRITDRLTTLYTRPIFDAALLKELDRSRRFAQPFSLILFDVDWLGAINAAHGDRIGDRVLERVGMLIREYFRQHDWAALHAEDSIAVLLPRTEAADATELADRIRETVEQRLAFTDAASRIVPVTISAAVVHVTASRIDPGVDPERLLALAEATLLRAKQHGRNRVEQSTY